MPTPDRRQFHDFPVQTFGDWDDVGRVKSALRQLENGQFSAAAQLVDAMGRDDRIRGALSQRVQGLLGLPLQFEPQGDARRGKSVAADLEGRWWGMFPEDQLAQMSKWGLQIGVGVGELRWERTASRWTPKLKGWHPQHLYWRWETRSYWVVAEEGEIEVTPGDGKWVLYTPGGAERGWMEGLVRCLAIPWLIRQWARRDWARFSEVHGMPARKAKVPAGASQEEKDRFFAELQGLSAEPTILLPTTPDGASFDFLLEEAKGDNPAAFERLLAHCETSISIAILGQNLTSEVKSGSFAAATVHGSVRQDILRADGNTLSTTLREQATRPWALFNFGDGELAPFACFDTKPPEDKKAKADTLSTLADAISKLKAAGITVDAVPLLEEHGVKVMKAEEPKPAPAPKPPVGDPAPGDGEEAAQLGRVGLASGKPLPKGAAAGQRYADDVAAAAAGDAAERLRPDVDALLQAIDNAQSFEELKAQLPKLFEAMSPDALSQLVEGTGLVAQLAGRYSIDRDV